MTQLILEYGMEETELSAPVAELMQHIWREAGGEIEQVLSSPLQSIKLDQVSFRHPIVISLSVTMFLPFFFYVLCSKYIDS